MSDQFTLSEADHCKIMPMWHGSDPAKCTSIASEGFTFFGKHAFFEQQEDDMSSTDAGYFGSGIYFTDSAKYATMYSDGPNGTKHLLLSWVSMKEPLPVMMFLIQTKAQICSH